MWMVQCRSNQAFLSSLSTKFSFFQVYEINDDDDDDNLQQFTWTVYIAVFFTFDIPSRKGWFYSLIKSKAYGKPFY